MTFLDCEVKNNAKIEPSKECDFDVLVKSMKFHFHLK